MNNSVVASRSQYWFHCLSELDQINVRTLLHRVDVNSGRIEFFQELPVHMPDDCDMPVPVEPPTPAPEPKEYPTQEQIDQMEAERLSFDGDGQS